MNWKTSTMLLVLACACCGCSQPEVGRVAGRVTLDGEPLAGATIVFEDAQHGVSVNATLGADGRYTAKTFDKPGLPPGSYKVAIRPGGIGSGEAPLVGEGDPSSPASQSIVPSHFQSVKTSGLSATVVAGENPPFDFALDSTAAVAN